MSEKFDLVLLAIFVIVQWRIGAALWKKHPRPVFRAFLATGAAVLGFAYACSFTPFVRALRLPPSAAEVTGAVAVTYLITATAVWAAYLVVTGIFKRILERMRAPTSPGRRQALNAAGNLAIAAPFIALGYGALIERTGFQVREVDAFIPHLAPDLEGVRVLQLSDIHLGPFLSEKQLARVIGMSLELKPHLAVITGDMISTHGDPLDACIRQLGRLKADAGIFGCMGNHEHFAGAEDYAEQAGARAGIRFLRGHSQPLQFGNAKLNLAGVDYQSRENKKAYLRGAERMVVPGEFNLLLSHNPDVFPVAAHQGYDLMLSGHTHGGQIDVEIFHRDVCPSRFFTPYIQGLYQIEAGGARGASAYVTRGVGTIGIPVRLGAPPEITLIRLRKA